MNFKEFTTILKEAKFRESSPALIKQVKKIAEAYYNVYSSKNNDLIKLIDSKKIVSFEKNKHYKPYFDHFGIEEINKLFLRQYTDYKCVMIWVYNPNQFTFPFNNSWLVRSYFIKRTTSRLKKLKKYLS